MLEVVCCPTALLKGLRADIYIDVIYAGYSRL